MVSTNLKFSSKIRLEKFERRKQMLKQLLTQLENSPTAYHAVENAKKILLGKGFCELYESNDWSIEKNSKYFVVADGSALIAFVTGTENSGVNIVASHTDSPALKLKFNPIVKQGKIVKLNVEKYGGGLLYSWLDIPLNIAGRIIVKEKNSGKLISKLVFDTHKIIIPSVAIHLDREVNSKGLVLNAQNDLQPMVSMNPDFQLKLFDDNKYEILDYDLYLTNASKPYLAGFDNEFLVSPRIDNLTSAFASIYAIVDINSKNIALTYLADNEEVGSATKQGAGGTFLKKTVERIAKSIKKDVDVMLSNSFMVSCDNAHATHPNHPEKSDPTNNVTLNGGVVIKHHANQNYTTDAFSSSVLKTIANRCNIATQDFFMRADMPCGGTLGAISSSQLSIRSVDIGLAQLAMHSATETMGSKDYDSLVTLLKQFYNSKIYCPRYHEIIVE